MLNYNGSLFPDNDPILNASNRAFRYGDGLFETMRVVNGKIPLFNYHFERLLRGMKALKINAPSYINVHYFKNEVLKTLDKNAFRTGTFERLARVGRGLYAYEFRP